MATCYRHPSRETNVSCSNCGRPICPDCMTSTPVGMRCPECASQRTQVRNPIGAAGRADAPATYAIIAICVAAFIGEIATGGTIGGGGGTLTSDGALFAYGIDAAGQTLGVAGGQPYRLVTSAFLHAGILHIGLNMFALYILGDPAGAGDRDGALRRHLRGLGPLRLVPGPGDRPGRSSRSAPPAGSSG